MILKSRQIKVLFSAVLISITLLISCTKQNPGIQHIELSDNWQFRLFSDTLIPGISNKYFDAVVPGCFHTDLYKNEIIGDPFYRNNEEMLQWLENMDWEYRSIFNVDHDLLRRSNIELEFKGLDTYADVYLNDEKILTADNMFRTWKVNCKELLKKGENELRIIFHSPIIIEKAKRDSLGFDLPDVRGFTRKAPYQYGWDWGPRFVTAGIWRPVFLSAWDMAKINDIKVSQEKIEKDTALVFIEFDIQAEDCLVSEMQLSVLNRKNQINRVNESFSLIPGSNKVKISLNIPDPQLWWPNGLGEPFLYDLQCELIVNEEVLDVKTFSIGLRTIELINDLDSNGESFYFKVNGVPVFIKGANYIPLNSFLTEVDEDNYRYILKSAVDANMNMLRVWGGGIYENDIFYDLCDEYGIMVWQDFMFACNMYPGDSAFLNNVKNEAIDNVKRLRNHPCLALWCGNNEVDEGWKNWGWQKSLNYTDEQSDLIWDNYQALFHGLLPSVIKEYNPELAYWPSSPKLGWGHKESMQEGDSHYWGVWWGEEPFEVYEEKTGRFMSEYGFQGYPDISTVSSFTVGSDRVVDSEVMKAHQKHPRGIELVETYMARDYQMPKDFNSFLYVSQLLQAEGIKIAIEAHRRAKPYCMGTLYWQLNDCWPVASWSGIDYYGHWKALHYFVREAFKTFLVSIDEKDKMLNVFIVSDSIDDINATLDLRLVTFEGEEILGEKIQLSIPELSSQVCYSIQTTDLLSGVKRDEVFLDIKLYQGRKIIARNIHYFAKPKELLLPPVEVSSKVTKTNDHWEIELSSYHLAKNVYLRVDGDDGFFSDNYFDLLPGETKLVNYFPESHKLDFKDKLLIQTLVDTYQQ